jgi:hypothetical protein
MNDSDVLCAVRDRLSEMPMPPRPPLETIVARGRASRRRRRAGLSAAGVAMGSVLALGLSAVMGSGSPAHTGAPVRLAAFSVVSNANGTTTLTFNVPIGLRDPNVVRHALAQRGIPAIVTIGKFCMTHVQIEAPGAVSLPGHSIVFNPAAMPARLEVSIGYVRDGFAVALIDRRAPLTCSSLLSGLEVPRRVPLRSPA